jgi:cation:H+ antiporter
LFKEILFLILGLILLAKGADFLVESAARLAKKIGVSDFVIGLTFVAIGTSLPELVASITAALAGHPLIITGNIIGSNIANIGLIVGIAAIIRTLYTKKRMYLRDSYILLLSVILFFFFVQDGVVTRIEGVIFIFLFVIYIMFLLRTKNERMKNYKFHDFLDYIFKFEYLTTVRSSMIRKAAQRKDRHKNSDRRILQMFKQSLLAEFLIIIVSGAAVIYGARFLINEAVWVASIFNLPDNLIGLSLVAVGTSLPELMVSVKAARKGYGGMVIGNIIGSNIANILFVFGVSAAIIPITIPELSITLTIPIMAFFTLAFVFFSRTGWRITKKAGIFLLLTYIAFMIAAFVMGWA